jgi:hypothetical protein
MDTTVVTALAAALGSLVGGTVSIGTTWISQRRQSIRATAEWKLREREMLYKEFIMEASRLFGDAMVNSLDRPGQLVALYGILNRIRLMAGDDVLSTAVDCCHRIVGIYRRPNMTADQIRSAFEANEFDPLKEFSAACRIELLAMSAVL